MKLGTHNSMTYLKPKHWYLYPFNFIAKCQDLTIEELYEYGVRSFDLRISYDNDGVPEFRHGLIAYEGDVFEVLKYLNSRKNVVYVRLWLECTTRDVRQEALFKEDCRLFERIYPNIRFHGGRSKAVEGLYDFNTKIPKTTEVYASYQLPLIDDLYPKRYAKKHNKEAKENCDKGILVLDFVEIG